MKKLIIVLLLSCVVSVAWGAEPKVYEILNDKNFSGRATFDAEKGIVTFYIFCKKYPTDFRKANFFGHASYPNEKLTYQLEVENVSNSCFYNESLVLNPTYHVSIDCKTPFMLGTTTVTGFHIRIYPWTNNIRRIYFGYDPTPKWKQFIRDKISAIKYNLRLKKLEKWKR